LEIGDLELPIEDGSEWDGYQSEPVDRSTSKKRGRRRARSTSSKSKKSASSKKSSKSKKGENKENDPTKKPYDQKLSSSKVKRSR